mgnify:CR=1 FL=1
MPSIRSTQIIDLLANAKQPLTLAALTKALGLKKGQENYKLTRTLDRLCKKGKLICDRRGRYSLPQKLDMIQGSVVGHPDGFGFLATGEGDDLFLSPRQMRKVLHGDRVLATVSRVDHRGRREGRIVEVLEHHNREVVGRFIEHNNCTLELAIKISVMDLDDNYGYGYGDWKRKAQLKVAELTKKQLEES